MEDRKHFDELPHTQHLSVKLLNWADFFTSIGTKVFGGSEFLGKVFMESISQEGLLLGKETGSRSGLTYLVGEYEF